MNAERKMQPFTVCDRRPHMGDRADSLPQREADLLFQREIDLFSHRGDAERAKGRRDEEDR
jgi:hypothetical protein